MPDDLDLALRVRADVAQAQQQLSALRASIQKSTGDVARANGREASAAGTAARATRALTQARERAAREGTEAARAAQQLARSLDTQTAAQTRANTATVQGTRRARQLAPAIQNTAFQVGDFAVQVASGTSALRAFAQQAPQLLGGFGVIGAVLGGLVAVGAALVPVFLDMDDAAEDSAEAMDRLADAADGLRTPERARADVDALAEAFGGAAAQARELYAARDRLAKREAARALTGVIAGLDDVPGAARSLDSALIFDLARQARGIVRERIGNLNQRELARRFGGLTNLILQEVVDAVKAVDISKFQGTVAATQAELITLLPGLVRLSEEAFDARATGTEAVPEIAENLGLAEEAARGLIAAYGELRAAEGFKARAAALGTFREALEAAISGTRGLSEKQRDALDGYLSRVLGAEEATLELVDASGDVAPGLDNAAAAAGRLADEVGRAVQSLATLQARAESRIRLARIRIDFADNPEERTRRLRIEARREAEAAILPGLRASGLGTAEIEIATRELSDRAGAAFDAQQAAQALEDRLRDLGRTGSAARTRGLPGDRAPGRSATQGGRGRPARLFRGRAGGARRCGEGLGRRVPESRGRPGRLRDRRQAQFQRSGEFDFGRSGADRHPPQYHRSDRRCARERARRRRLRRLRWWRRGGVFGGARAHTPTVAVSPWRRADRPGHAGPRARRGARPADARRGGDHIRPVKSPARHRSRGTGPRPRNDNPARGGALPHRRRGRPAGRRYDPGSRGRRGHGIRAPDERQRRDQQCRHAAARRKRRRAGRCARVRRQPVSGRSGRRWPDGAGASRTLCPGRVSNGMA